MLHFLHLFHLIVSVVHTEVGVVMSWLIWVHIRTFLCLLTVLRISSRYLGQVLVVYLEFVFWVVLGSLKTIQFLCVLLIRRLNLQLTTIFYLCLHHYLIMLSHHFDIGVSNAIVLWSICHVHLHCYVNACLCHIVCLLPFDKLIIDPLISLRIPRMRHVVHNL